jgi:hypothetical protein
MDRITLWRDAGDQRTLPSYWWELYVAYARLHDWSPEGWEPPLEGTQQVSGAEAARLADALEQVLSGPPPADPMSREDLAGLKAFLRRGAFRLEICEEPGESGASGVM